MILPTLFGESLIKSHSDTNHLYDTNLPYSYHLSLVVLTATQFDYLIPEKLRNVIIDGCWGHDGMEDARLSYNDILKLALKAGHSISESKQIAEICRAVTNNSRGRTREEKMPDHIYKDIREVEGATFVKLCDRIANVKHGLITGSRMRSLYKKEQNHFKEMLYTEKLEPMWIVLDNLLTINLEGILSLK